MKEAAIDNDFVMHLAEINWTMKELNEKVGVFFSSMDICPIMHELVYTNEMQGGADFKDKTKAMSFFQNNIINEKKMNSFLETNAKKKYYEMVFKEIYRDLKGNLPAGIKNIFVDWVAHSSLGETHTVAMCCVLECDIFLSDDGDSKQLATILENKKAFSINVYNRSDAMKELVKDYSKLNKHDRRTLKHVPK